MNYNVQFNLEIDFDNKMPNVYRQKIYKYLSENLVNPQGNEWYSKNFNHPIEDLMGVVDELMNHKIVLKHITKLLFNNVLKQTFENGLSSYAQEIRNARSQ